jgi:hypothetical protein
LPVPSAPASPPSSQSRVLAVLGNVEQRILAALLLGMGSSVLIALLALPWTGWLDVLLSTLGTLVLLVVLSTAWYIGLTLALRQMRKTAERELTAAQAAQDAQTGRNLGVTLSPARHALLEQIQRAADGIRAKAALVPYEGTRALAEGMVERQTTMLPEVEHSLRWAQYLDDQATELAARSPGSAEPGKLDAVRARAAELDQETARIAELLADSEASLLAMVSERDERVATDSLVAYSTELDMHFEVVRSVNADVAARISTARDFPTEDDAVAMVGGG